MEKQIVNLGWMNGWHGEIEEKNRQILRECSAKGHKVKENGDFCRCVSETTCVECGYTFKVDSSG